MDFRLKVHPHRARGYVQGIEAEEGKHWCCTQYETVRKGQWKHEFVVDMDCEHQRTEIADCEYSSLVRLAQSIRIPLGIDLAPEVRLGGTLYWLLRDYGTSSATFMWSGEVPSGWDGLASVAERIQDLCTGPS